MAYTIVKSDGTILTTVPDGTVNTTSTSLDLPGRNYAGYGQSVDTNFVHQLESYADTTPPENPLRGQLWFNINNNTMYICPSDGEANALAWIALTSVSSGGTTTFGNVTVTGDLLANNITATNNSNANSATFTYLTVTVSANVASGNITTGNIGSLTTSDISTGNIGTTGSLTGVWTSNGTGTVSYGGPSPGSAANTAFYVTGGNLVINPAAAGGIKTDNYYYANGTPISFAGTYGNANVAAYLPTYNGNILAANVRTSIMTTGANTTEGTLTGTWTANGGGVANGITGTTLLVTNGNIVISGASAGIRTDNYYYANGTPISFAGIYSNANVANYLPVYTGSIGGTLTTASQPNISSVGTLTSLIVNGNVNSGNASFSGRVAIGGATGTDKTVLTPQSLGNGILQSAVNNAENTFVPSTQDASRFVWRPSGVEGMRIESTGNVGIGTVSPSQKLDVNGSLKLSGAVYENVFTITDGTSVNINPANGTIQLWTLGANRTPTATNFASGQSITLMVNDGANYNIDWTSIGVNWKTDGGFRPILNATGYTAIVLWKIFNVVYGARVGDA